MRKNFLFAAAGTMCLMLASCSADDPVAQNTTDGAINYTVVAANQSRAAHSYCANNMPDGFKVWAKHGSNIYIDGDVIEKNGNGDYVDVTGTRFWPADNPTLSFYAVADAEGSDVVFNNDGKLVVPSYTIKDGVADQLDLMYAVNIDATYNTGDPKVKLNFRHALSQICFRASNQSTTNRITIKSVSVHGLYNTGTYTLPSESTDGNISDHPTATVDNRTHGEWTDRDGKKSYTPFFNETGVELENTVKSLTGGSINDHTTDEEWADVLTLLPQTQSAATINNNTAPAADATGAYFKLTLVVENISKNASGNVTYEPVHTGDFDLYLGANIVWEEGNRYIYTFNFGKDWSPANLNAVEYTVSTDDFIEVDLNPIINGHEAVLMREKTATQEALYVATKNIGATPSDDFGLYFWWGDTEGQYNDDNMNSEIFEKNNDAIKTWGKSLEDLESTGWVQAPLADGNYKLTPTHDAAVQKWGNPWRMPTKEDFDWLQNNNNCTWTAVKDNTGKLIGVKVVSKTTGGEIYLPAASCFEDCQFQGVGDKYKNQCFYWSSTVNPKEHGDIENWYRVYRLNVSEKGDKLTENVASNANFYNGFPIRAVANSVE